MASFGYGEYHFRIVDFRRLTNEKFFDQVQFKEKLAELTYHGAIQKFSVFESKLNGVPAPLMKVNMPEGKRLCHEYVDMEIKDEAGKTCFVSIEKGQQGILAQIGAIQESVTHWREKATKYKESKGGKKGKEICVKEERVKSKFQPQSHLDMTNINFLTTKKVVTIAEFLDIDEGYFTINPRYHLFTGNCQLFVRDSRNQLNLMARSREIKFTLPGSGGKKVPIDDPQVIKHLECMYPNLTCLAEIPEVEEQFIAYTGKTRFQSEDTSIDSNEKEQEIESLKLRQELYRNISDEMKVGSMVSLLEAAFSDSSHVQSARHSPTPNAWRVIFTNLAARRVKTALESASMPSLNVKSISNFWREAFDILVFAPEIGCTIIQFDKPDATPRSSLEAQNAKKDMLAELGEVCVDTINTIAVKTPAFSKDAVRKSANEVHEKLVKIKNEATMQMAPAVAKHLIAKLVMLNRLENNGILLHDKLEKQEWGNAAMFTEEQHRAMEMARSAFEKGRPLHLAAIGPPGAGKTLVLFEMAREYLRIVKDEDKKVFIEIPIVHAELTRHLQHRIKEDEQMRGRLAVGGGAEYLAFLKRDLILVDEAGASISNMIRFDKVCPSQSLVLFSSYGFAKENVDETFPRRGFKFQYIQFSHSLRATAKLTEFVAGLHSVVVSQTLSPTVGVAIEGSAEDVVRVTTPWGLQRKFIGATIEKLKGLHKKSFSVSTAAKSILVLVLGHWLLRSEIENMLKHLGIWNDFKFIEELMAMDCQGAQWPAVAIIIDGSTNTSLISSFPSILTVATRATTSLLFIYHDAQETMKIGGLIALESIHITKSQLASTLKEMSSIRITGKERILVVDGDHDFLDLVGGSSPILSDEERENLERQHHLEFGWRTNWRPKDDREKTKDVALLALVLNIESGSLLQWISVSHAPVKVFFVHDDEKERNECELAMNFFPINLFNYLNKAAKVV